MERPSVMQAGVGLSPERRTRRTPRVHHGVGQHGQAHHRDALPGSLRQSVGLPTRTFSLLLEPVDQSNMSTYMSTEPAAPATPDNRLRLHQGEHVVLEVLPSKWWTLNRYIVTLGLWGVWRKRHRFVLTNQRVVLLKGIVSKSERSAPLSRIQDAHLRRSPLAGGAVALSTAGGPLGVDLIGPLTQADALRFADALTPLLGLSPQGA